MARAIDSEVAFRFLTEQLVKETGAFSKGVNKGLNIARSAMRNPDAIPTLTPPNEPLTCGLVDRHGMPLRAGDTVAADKFFVYAVRYGSHNVNPDNCAPAYQVGWYLEIMWAYPGFEDSVGHTEPLYDIDGTAARYPAHCADTADGLYNLKLEVCCRPPGGEANG